MFFSQLSAYAGAAYLRFDYLKHTPATASVMHNGGFVSADGRSITFHK